MSTSPVQIAIRAASKAAFDNGLKAAGFRRQGNHLHRPSHDLIQAFNFQASRGSAVPLGEFTVNLVVTADFIYRHWIGRPLPKNPAAALFPIQQRIGLLMPQREDKWWPADADIDALCVEVGHVLVAYGLPFFAAFPSVNALLERLRSGTGAPGMSPAQATLLHAMLAKEKGFDDEAEQQIRGAFEDARGSGFQETVGTIARRLGIAPP
jgi:hypothetical protein